MYKDGHDNGQEKKKDQTEAEEIKKRWQEYTHKKKTVQKKVLMIRITMMV